MFAILLFLFRLPLDLNPQVFPENHPHISDDIPKIIPDKVYGKVDGMLVTGADVIRIIEIIEIIDNSVKDPFNTALEKAIEIKLLLLEAKKMGVSVSKEKIDSVYRTLVHDMHSDPHASVSDKEEEVMRYMIEVNLLKSKIGEYKGLSSTQIDEWMKTAVVSSRVQRFVD